MLGVFSSRNLGKILAYKTKLKGEFVLLEFVDGNRILISRKYSDAFPNTLESKAPLTSLVGGVKEHYHARRLAYAQLVVVGVMNRFSPIYRAPILQLYPR